MKLIKVNVLKEWIENWFTKNRAYHPYAKNNNIPITELYDILEQMPSVQPDVPDTNVGDMISRRRLQDAMYHEAFETDSDMQKWDSGCWIRYKMFENVVETLPSAQPEPKKGKWIEEIGMLMCSECGDAWGTEQFDEVTSFNFCPNCGAKMEEEG